MLKNAAFGCILTTLAWATICSAADLRTTNLSTTYVPPGAVSLGAELRSGKSPYIGVDNTSSQLNDNRVDLIPLYLYEDKWLFARGTSAGVHLFSNGALTVDTLIKYRFDRLEADSNAYFAGMEDRKQSVDGGLSAAFSGDWGAVSATWLSDFMGHHNGAEWDISYRYPWQSGRLVMSPFVSYVYQDRDLVDYYYGVRDDEALPDRPAYRAGSASFWRAGISISYRVSQRVMVFSNIAVEQLDQEVRNSPLVDEKQLGEATVGFAYSFGNIWDDATRQDNSTRLGEWSWRLNTGYQAQGPFHTTHRGDLQRSRDVHAYMAGLTLGKLLSDGRYLDYWGRISVNRRFENGYQDDFFEYNAYVMAMTTLHSSKTHKELFRYGLGFGFSYASKVPMVEQVKQARRDRNTAHFLNYLEAQFDVPLSLVFGEHVSRDCYTGISLLHRSGIFANSDILGNVSGGSDMVTFHVECKR